MNTSKRYQVTAALFDVLFMGTVISTFLGVLRAFIHISWFETLLSVLVVSYLLFIIVYHSVLSKRLNVCTFGERMTGCSLETGQKHWRNPFQRSRWLLFLSLFIVLLYPANTFDSILDTDTPRPPLNVVAAKSLRVLLFFTAVFKISQGVFKWAGVIYFYQGIRLLQIVWRCLDGGPLVNVMWTLLMIDVITLTMLSVCLTIYLPCEINVNTIETSPPS